MLRSFLRYGIFKNAFVRTYSTQHYFGRETVGELIMTNRVEQALPIINDLIRAEGDNVALYIDKGTALLALEHHTEALECFNIALKMDPDAINESQLNLNKGSTLLKMGLFNEAMVCYNRAIELRPDDSTYYDNRAMAYMFNGHDENALSDLKTSLELKPSLRTFVNMGNALRRLDKSKEALECFDQALEIDPQDVTALESKANVLIADERYQESLDCIDRALIHDHNNASLFYKRGVLLCKLGRISEGVPCLERVMMLDSSKEKQVQKILDAIKRP
jgi:tetratricopeptide (TPR) repeat protein